MTDRQWRDAPPAQSGPPGSPLQLSGWRPGGAGSHSHLCLLVLTHGLINGRTRPQVHGEGVCPPCWRPSSCPPGRSRGSNCISGAISISMMCLCPCAVSAGGLQGKDQVLRAEPESEKLNHRSLPLVEVMFSRGTHIPNEHVWHCQKGHNTFHLGCPEMQNVEISVALVVTAWLSPMGCIAFLS